MSLELDAFYRAADPIFAIKAAIPPIIGAALFAFWIIRRASQPTKVRSAVAFAAEIFVIFGIIGVFSFVGRSRNEALSAINLTKLEEAEYAQAVEVHQLSRVICANIDMSPLKTHAAEKLACDRFTRAKSMFQQDGSNAFWARDLSDLSEIGNLPEDKVRLLRRASDAVWKFIEAKDDRAMHEKRLREASAQAQWQIALVIAISVAVGAGLKCGRAAAELWPKVAGSI